MAKEKGSPKTGGRKAGTPNKIPREIKDLARVYTPDGIEQLAVMAGLVEGKPASENDAARISAIKELLDRGHGRSPQPVAHAGEGGEGPIKIEFSWAASKGS
jgi:hypothetical protein